MAALLIRFLGTSGDYIKVLAVTAPPCPVLRPPSRQTWNAWAVDVDKGARHFPKLKTPSPMLAQLNCDIARERDL